MPATVKQHAPCVSCGADLHGGFCSACGEPAVHEGDLSLRHLTHEFLHEFTHLDGKIWRTLFALLFQPGRLTKEYWSGRRGRWIRPLRLYLVISALTLLFAANAAGPLGLRVWVTGDGNYTVGSRPTNGPQVTPIDAEVSHRVQSVYLWIRYLSLGVFAGASLLAYRKKQRFYGAHIILGMHFYSFEYIVSGALARAWPNAAVGPVITVVIGFVYLWICLRRLYGEGWLRTFFKSLLLFFAVAFAEMVTVGGSVFAAATMFKH
ncbi:MAG TPA: DUF3667 domain-containing protein [Bryobacteraceae bacterium]|nr:DUF3667 domain-containing protein [Bryobacteraceae bacterium]